MGTSTDQKLSHQLVRFLCIKINNNCIDNIKNHKILGITVDYRLKWSDHTNNITKRVRIGINTVKRIRGIMR